GRTMTMGLLGASIKKFGTLLSRIFLRLEVYSATILDRQYTGFRPYKHTNVRNLLNEFAESQRWESKVMFTEFRKVLARVRRDPELSLADKKHLERWASYGDDLPWEKIETDAERHGLHPTGTSCETVVRYSLMSRRIAEDAQSGNDPLFEERKRQRDELLELAEAKALAKYYEDAEELSGIAMFFQRFLRPVSELRLLHEREAVLLRQRAGREPTRTTFISRQRRGKKRRHSRK